MKIKFGKNIVNGFVAFIMLAALSASTLATLPVSAAEVNLGGSRDCDANAIIYCGTLSTTELINSYNSGKESTDAKSIQDTFTYFGISSAQVNNMRTTAVAGSVNSKGEVFVNGNNTAVATGAVTAGRQNMPGSTQVNQNGTVFYTRPTGVSFRSGSIPAFVVMENGVFKYAVLGSCGNPVKATPKVQPKPDHDINKTVAVHGTTTFVKSVNVKSNTKVVYRISVNNPGAGNLPGFIVRDALPAGATYVDGTLTRDGTPADAAAFFGNGMVTGALAAGATTVFQFDAMIAPGEKSDACKPARLVNTAFIAADGLAGEQSSAEVNKECAPVKAQTAPVCTVLNITPGDGRKVTIRDYNFTLNGATLKSGVIDWGDGTKTGAVAPNQIVGQQHVYGADGNYTVTLTLTFDQNGKTVVSSEAGCKQPVSFNTAAPVATQPQPVLPATGAGAIAGVFAAVSALGAVAHRWFLSRRIV